MGNLFDKNNWFNLTTILLIMSLYPCTMKKSRNSPSTRARRKYNYTGEGPFRYADIPDENWDPFWYHIVGIRYDPGNVTITTGVFFDRDRIITSFNPFRRYLKNRTNIESISVVIANKRYNIGPDFYNLVYDINAFYVECGRQIVPAREEPKIWHANDKKHCPTHDLMIFRISYIADFLPNYKFADQNKFVNKPSKKGEEIGPLKIELAKPNDTLGRDIKYASLGFLSIRHMLRYNILYFDTLTHDMDAIADCDEWFPKDWGHFICIKNVFDNEGIGSGSILVHKDKLYGIGSFALRKGTQGILVFTDVRKYYDLIWKTCNREDQELEELPDEIDGRFDGK